MKKHYKTLGLLEGASQEEIQTAYERLSKELDPKNNNDQEFFVEEYQKVQEAYEALRNSSILATEKGARINVSDKKSSSRKKTKVITPMNPTTKNFSLNKKILAGITIALIIFGVTYTVFKASSPPNPVYLDANGITIKAHKWAKIGDQGTIDEVLYTIVDKDSLLIMIKKGRLLNRVCTSLMTDMNGLFLGEEAFNQDISNWDVSNVNDMREMFRNAASFNQPIGVWDVSNVTRMGSMFYGANTFNQPIETWEVSNVNNMYSMFRDAVSFNQPIGAWDVSNVTRMEFMFSGATTFNQPIGTWDVSKVNSMKAMFSCHIYAYGFDGLRLRSTAQPNFNQNIGSWNVSNVEDMGLMFAGALSFNQDLSSWNVSNVTSMGGMFYNASSFNQSLDSWDVSRNKILIFKNSPDDFEFSVGTSDWTLPKPNFKN
jgi:surface protein